jgi:hypothetical protein
MSVRQSQGHRAHGFSGWYALCYETVLSASLAEMRQCGPRLSRWALGVHLIALGTSFVKSASVRCSIGSDRNTVLDDLHAQSDACPLCL